MIEEAAAGQADALEVDDDRCRIGFCDLCLLFQNLAQRFGGFATADVDAVLANVDDGIGLIVGRAADFVQAAFGAVEEGGAPEVDRVVGAQGGAEELPAL